MSQAIIPLPKKGKLVPLGGSLAAETAFPKIKYLWPEWIVEKQVNVISGPAGVNKSTLAHLIAAKLSVGLTPKNEVILDNRRTLYYGYEDGPEIINQRISWFNANPGKIRIVDGIEEERYFDEPDAIESDIAQFRPRLVVFDVFRAAFGGLNIDTAKHVNGVFKTMTNWCKKYNCTIILIHHSKNNPKAKEDCLEGSAALKKAIRSALYVSKWDMQGSNSRAIVPLKTSWSKEPKPLHFWINSVEGRLAVEVGDEMEFTDLNEIITLQNNYYKTIAKNKLKKIGVAEDIVEVED